MAPGLPEHGPSLSSGGGGGSHGVVSTSYLLHPVPAPGPVALWLAWPARGIDETRVEFDGSGLAQLVTQVEVLWPAETSPIWPPAPPKPKLPGGGRFETYLAST
jgi:hypothetical protein